MCVVTLVFEVEAVSVSVGKTWLLVGAVALNGNICANNGGLSSPIILQSLNFT